ncbi:MAG TPA: hypothetical protein VLG92_03305 [Candidatus Saccharimonadia bacterium]|nr:hypothetical protein [Candidatus Saccharimonadia bacterium]
MCFQHPRGAKYDGSHQTRTQERAYPKLAPIRAGGNHRDDGHSQGEEEQYEQNDQ